MPLGKTIVVLAAALTLGVGGAAFAASSHHSRPAHAVKSAGMAAEQTSPDTDNIQSGDQTTPDSTATGMSGAGESSSGSEVPGNDGPGGHADEPGNPNADHQFQGQE
jgi:hypothetical protein